jgi:hypothetical protein
MRLFSALRSDQSDFPNNANAVASKFGLGWNASNTLNSFSETVWRIRNDESLH